MADLEQLASDTVQLALAKGASDAECTVAEGSEFSVTVRMGEVEQVKEAGSRAIGIRVLFGNRTGSAYTSDLSRDGVERMVAQAVELAAITGDDPNTGLPDRAELGKFAGDLGLYHADTLALPNAQRIEMARRAERAALDADPRVNNSEGGSFDSGDGHRVFANSRGFTGAYRYTSCSLSAVPVAKQNGSMERDFWASSARSPAKLEDPEYVGRKAAERVLRRLNPRKAPTQRCPVLFDTRMARSLVGHLFDAVNGTSIYRKSSFLVDKLGEVVASPLLNMIDDGTMPGLFGSGPFDDEGVASRRTVIVGQGRLENYLLNCYAARKLGMKTTGSATRGVSGNSGVGHGNLYFEAGATPEPEMIRGIANGLYVTELIGSGVNAVTGDYSRGASGLWIENGELAYPVSEITIAGNLKDMLRNISAVGSELEFRGAVASPAILIGEMTISGQ